MLNEYKRALLLQTLLLLVKLDDQLNKKAIQTSTSYEQKAHMESLKMNPFFLDLSFLAKYSVKQIKFENIH